jgi:hypothetical protein
MSLRDERRLAGYKPEDPAEIARLLDSLNDDNPEPFDPFRKGNASP